MGLIDFPYCHSYSFKSDNPYLGAVMAELTNNQFLTLLLEILENNGCTLADIDFNEKVIHLEGSEAAKARCSLALQDILG